MVIGRGLIAKAFMHEFHEREDVVLFASGVSHSKDCDFAQTERERSLLTDSIQRSIGKTFVYFSTCSVYDPSVAETLYVKHKLEMEEIILNADLAPYVFRVSNVVGLSDNPSTIFNFLAQHIMNEIPFNLWSGAVRNIIDVEHVVAMVKYYLESGSSTERVINIASPVQFLVTDLVARMESFFGKKAHFNLIDAGAPFAIDTTVAQNIATKIGIDFSNGYIDHLLQKYYK